MSLDDRLRAAVVDDLTTGVDRPGLDASYYARQTDPDALVALLDGLGHERGGAIDRDYCTRLVGMAVAAHPNRRAFEERGEDYPGHDWRR